MLEQDYLLHRAALSEESSCESIALPDTACKEKRLWLRGALVCFLVTGSMAGLALFAANALDLMPWVLFLAWVGFGLTGGSPASGARLLAGFVAGATVGAATVLLGTAWSPWLAEGAMPVALALSCGMLATLEKRPPFDAVPAYFLGMIAFFASGRSPTGMAIAELLAPAVMGVLWGWGATRSQAVLEQWFDAS